MKIIVVGCGKVGASITAQLAGHGHDIAVIDHNSSVIEEITNSYDVMGLVGNGASYSMQKEAGVEEADLLIAVTNSDEQNMLCCLVARKAGGCSTIARVRNPVYSSEIGFLKEELGLSLVVNPEEAGAREAARLIRMPSAIQVEKFAKGHVHLIKALIPSGSPISGMALSDISRKLQADVLICTVERGRDIEIPNGQYVLQEGDTISIVASPENVRKFLVRIGLDYKPVKDTMIIGGGRISYYLAKRLLQDGTRVKIIEKDLQRCEELSELLPTATIIHADASSEDVLIEEGIETCGSFVTLTGMDEENIFLSLFAQSCSKAKVITKVDKIAFDEVIRHFKLGSILHPKKIIADTITRYVRAMQNSIGSNVESLYHIMEDRVEALEFSIHEDAPVVGIPLADLKLKKNVLVACIYRSGSIIIPNGQSVIEVGDSVIVVTKEQGFEDIRDILL